MMDLTYQEIQRNIRIKGKFDKLTPVGKWYFLMMANYSNYSYNGDGNDGIFVEYFQMEIPKTSENLRKILDQVFGKHTISMEM